MKKGDIVKLKQRRRVWYNAPAGIRTPVDPRYKQVDTLEACTATVRQIYVDSFVVEHQDGTLEECDYGEVERQMRKYIVKCEANTDPTKPGCFAGIASEFFESSPEMIEQNEEVEIYEFTSEHDMDRILDLQEGIIEYEVQIL